MGILKDKTILIMGLRNRWSIAWGVVNSCLREGAKIIITYRGDREKERIIKLTRDLTDIQLVKCDVSYDEEINA